MTFINGIQGWLEYDRILFLKKDRLFDLERLIYDGRLNFFKKTIGIVVY